MKKDDLIKLVREEMQSFLKEAPKGDNSAIEKSVSAAFKKMGLKVVKIDANAFGIGTPKVDVTFKDLSYGGGDEYDIMNDYNDEYREDGDVVFMDVSSDERNPNKLYFYIDKKESNLSEGSAPAVNKLVQSMSKLSAADADDLEDMTAVQTKALAKIGVEVSKKFPKLTNKEILEYLYGIWDSSWRSSYTHEYSQKFYDDDKYTKAWTAHAKDFARNHHWSISEAKTKIDDQGSAQDYYGVTSDIIETWDSTETITRDIAAFLKAAHGTAGKPGSQHGGGQLVQDIIKAMMAGINKSRYLVNTDRFSHKVKPDYHESYLGSVDKNESLKEDTINKFNIATSTSGYGPKISPALLKKIMPKTAATMEEAEDQLSKFEGGPMFRHSQTFFVSPKRGESLAVAPGSDTKGKLTYYLGQGQFWLRKEDVNVTFLLIKDVTDPSNEKKMGWALVDTDVFLKECEQLFDIVKKRS